MESQLDTPRHKHPAMTVVTELFSKAIEAIPQELLELEEHELVEKVYGDKHPSSYDKKLRFNFYQEYNRAIQTGSTVINKAIYDGVCTVQAFLNIIRDPGKLAYILCPPEHDVQKRQHIIDMGLRRLKEIMSMRPQVNQKTGLVDTKLLELQTKILIFMYEHEYGKAVETQNVNQTTKSFNVNVTQPQLSPQELDAKLAELRAKALEQPMENKIALPVERVVQEAGRVTEEFKR